MTTIRIGTRGSQLALWQANYIQSTLQKEHPNQIFEQVIIKTEGDADQKSSLTQIGGQGVFTKAIEDALLDKRIDIAVHSLKDLPSQNPVGLELGAVPPRAVVEDVLVTSDGLSIKDLPEDSPVATGSMRRRSQLLNLRPDLKLQDLRGNIDTRLRKLHEQELAGIIMAKAAIIRLQLEQVNYYTFSTEEMIPSPGQGAIGVQIRSGDEISKNIVSNINHQESFLAVTAERAFLNELDSGCQFPIGGNAIIQGQQLSLKGFVGSEDGKTVIREQINGDPQNAEELGRELAKKFIDRGALDILRQSAP
jgi:hydroxymethylbilane synthase